MTLSARRPPMSRQSLADQYARLPVNDGLSARDQFRLTAAFLDMEPALDALVEAELAALRGQIGARS